MGLRLKIEEILYLMAGKKWGFAKFPVVTKFGKDCVDLRTNTIPDCTFLYRIKKLYIITRHFWDAMFNKYNLVVCLVT